SEDCESRGVTERRRFRPVDAHVRGGGGGGEPLTGGGVGAGGGGGGHGSMPAREVLGEELGPDQPGPADDDDLHESAPCGRGIDKNTVTRPRRRSHPWNSPVRHEPQTRD